MLFKLTKILLVLEKYLLKNEGSLVYILIHFLYVITQVFPFCPNTYFSVCQYSY